MIHFLLSIALARPQAEPKLVPEILKRPCYVAHFDPLTMDLYHPGALYCQNFCVFEPAWGPLIIRERTTCK